MTVNPTPYIQHRERAIQDLGACGAQGEYTARAGCTARLIPRPTPPTKCGT
jgi:hypothetical protein